MLPEEHDVVCQSPVVLLLCFSHIPTFTWPHHCTGRVLRALLASACRLLMTAPGRTRQVTISSRLALPICRLASNVCLRYVVTANMLSLVPSFFWYVPVSAL